MPHPFSSAWVRLLRTPSAAICGPCGGSDEPMNGLDEHSRTAKRRTGTCTSQPSRRAIPRTPLEPWTFQRFKEITTSRLSIIPQFRCKVAQSVLGLGRPGWADRRRFRSDSHIRRIAVPSPGGPHELGELVGDLAAGSTAPNPSGEMWVIEGLSGEESAFSRRCTTRSLTACPGLSLQPCSSMFSRRFRRWSGPTVSPIDPEYLSKPTTMSWV